MFSAPPQQLMERLKRIVKLPHRLRPVQSSKVGGPAHRPHTDTRLAEHTHIALVKASQVHLVHSCSPLISTTVSQDPPPLLFWRVLPGGLGGWAEVTGSALTLSLSDALTGVQVCCRSDRRRPYIFS